MGGKNEHNIELDFREKVSDEVRLLPHGSGFAVSTPFTFDDGDEYVIILRRTSTGWVLSDEGHTFMHLSYKMDERDWQRGTRDKIIREALSMFRTELKEGVLNRPIDDDEFGNALFDFIQAISKITGVTYLAREHVRSTFVDDFDAFIRSAVPAERLAFEWHDPTRDPDGIYTADIRINSRERPLFIYAVNSENRANDATISLLKFESWGMRFDSIGVLEDLDALTKKTASRFIDTAGKIFTSLHPNRERIQQLLHDLLIENSSARPSTSPSSKRNDEPPRES